MYCIKCGVKLSDNQKSCPLCGTVVFHPEVMPNGDPLYPAEQHPAPQVRSQAALVVITTLFLLPLIMQRSPLAIISAGFLTSLAIECIQPFLNPYRAADITDLITNTVGTVIGYFLYRLLREHIQNMLNRI